MRVDKNVIETDFTLVPSKPIEVFAKIFKTASRDKSVSLDRRDFYWSMSQIMFNKIEKILQTRQVVAFDFCGDGDEDRRLSPFGIPIRISTGMTDQDIRLCCNEYFYTGTNIVFEGDEASDEPICIDRPFP